ncbi:hypothetical protein SARC_12147 [Sphaeroforma arctica JP610]|uniref:Thioredoxin domain-containing protein n=1 Tax=Sphaeroforma arctica JP610 TaxID=667725 RepID=A0A0L0FEZ7_9EUKA|nr:hypothetical protein SARC_12147 [Sphaeroforma arctica JP610]KNC75325.1 hypothetical protein SARC_12147 [Sphaeroforma arctica JP610]|eukprot:XP_014149227.1 hypothetical protein SARC_12147 [Sphaeroforma arctica JP610]
MYFHLQLIAGVARADLSNGEVDVLTEDNFDKKTSRGTWLIEFYAPWCGHCKKLEPTFKAAARLLSGRVSLGKVDCTSQPALGTRFGVSGYPTIKAIGDIGVLDYRGARTVPAFVEYGELLSQPAIKAYAEQSNYKGEGKPVFLLLGGRAGEKKVYAKVAEARKMQSVFTYFTIPERPSPLGQEILAMLGITTQVDRESYRSGEERRLVIISESKVFDYRGIWDAEHMGSWVDRLKFGYMPQIANGLNNTYQYKDIKSPNSTIIIAAYSIVDEKEPSEIVKASMEEICENEFVRTSEMASPGKYYRCFWLHGPDMSKLLREEFGLDGIKNVPLIFAVNSDSDYFFHDDDPRSSAADAKDFVERLKKWGCQWPWFRNRSLHTGMSSRLSADPVLYSLQGNFSYLVHTAFYKGSDLFVLYG